MFVQDRRSNARIIENTNHSWPWISNVEIEKMR